VVVAIAAAACVDVTLPEDATVSTADLVVLPLDAAAPPPQPASFYVTNAAAAVRTLRHPDAFNTLYLELRFAAGGIASLNGQPVGPADSVLVTVTPLAAGYGFTLAPAGLTFTPGIQPTALLSFGRYGDASMADGLFTSRDAYVAALDIWTEVGVERWSVARNSVATGIDEVRATVEAPGRFRLAAVPP
jgi:hypothetical protein